jgi:hypothetical protein
VCARPIEETGHIEIELTNHLREVSGLVTDDRGTSLRDHTAVTFARDERKWKGTSRLDVHRLSNLPQTAHIRIRDVSGVHDWRVRKINGWDEMERVEGGGVDWLDELPR